MFNPFQRAVAWLAEAAGVVSGDMTDPRWWGQAGLGSTAGVTVTAESALQLGVVQSVMARLAGTISALPLMVFERDGENRKPAREHPLFRLLHSRPNRTQTAQEFRDQLERDLAWERNAYYWIHEDAEGFPVGELEWIAPRRMTRVFWAGGRRMYDFRDINGERQVKSEDEVWHIRMAPLTPDGLKGIPVYETARETLGRALAVEQFGSRFFANSSHAGGVIKHPGRFKDKDEESNFLSAWRSSGSGPNQHKDRLLLNGADYVPPGLTNEASQFVETRKEMNYALASLWNMPGHMVGLLDRATFSNIEQQSIEYVVHTISPFVTAIEQSAALNLLIGQDQDRYFVEFNLAGLLRGDLKSRWQAYAWGRNWGWLSVNDIRRLENMDEIGAQGDVYLQPTNMTPAGTPVADDKGGAGDTDPQDPADLQEDMDAR
jgi:HK97 family phage portal protein